MKLSMPGMAAAFLSLLVLACWGCGGDRHDTMPVLLITADGLAGDRLAPFGGAEAAPALEELANEGVVWREAWTTSPMTRPAVASYLTGLAPDRHGMRDDLYSILPENVQTLAALLAEKGYSTAAFPNSSFLGRDSGLMRGFDLVDVPPETPIGPERMMPLVRAASSGAENFRIWMESMPEGSNYFAWFHFSGLELDQLSDFLQSSATETGLRSKYRQLKPGGKGKAGEGADAEPPESVEPAEAFTKGRAKGVPPDEGHAVESFDDALRIILDTIDERSESGSALVIVAGTSADIGGGAEDARGPGFSLDELAIKVPVVARFPSWARKPRDPDAIVWAPDVAATIADLAAVRLDPAAEGVSLLESAPDDRIIFSWSWATLDQMGWLPLRAARMGDSKMQQGAEPALVNLGEEGAEVDGDAEARLGEALAARTELPPQVIDQELVLPWLEGMGIEPDPLPAGGRRFDSREERRRASDFLWKARLTLARHYWGRVRVNYGTSRAADPDAFCPMFEPAQNHVLSWSEEGVGMMTDVVKRYPFKLDALHWYVHAIWREHWQEGEKMIDILLTYLPHDPDLLYDKACARSLAGDIPESLDFLETAIQAGFERWNVIEGDRDLRNLRESPAFSELLRNYGR